MNIFKSMGISANGLQVQKSVLEIISMNIANSQTTRSASGEPYRRRRIQIYSNHIHPQFSITLSRKLQNISNLYITHPKHFKDMELQKREVFQEDPIIQAIAFQDDRPFQIIYDPSHPDANHEGFVLLPNINIIEEMVDMMRAVRSYEANITAFNAAKSMALKALEIGR